MSALLPHSAACAACGGLCTARKDTDVKCTRSAAMKSPTGGTVPFGREVTRCSSALALQRSGIGHRDGGSMHGAKRNRSNDTTTTCAGNRVRFRAVVSINSLDAVREGDYILGSSTHLFIVTHHLDELLIVDLAVAVGVRFTEDLLGLLFRELLALAAHDIAQLGGGDGTAVVLV